MTIRQLCALTLLVCLWTSEGAHAADQPTPVIAILDVQRILRESAPSKSIRPQIEKMRKSYQDEVKKEEGQLRKSEQDLISQRAILAPEAFAKKRSEFERTAKEAQRKVQNRKRSLDRAFSLAMDKVRNTLVEVAADIAKEKNINIVLPKSVVVLSKKNLDITEETIKRLNKRLPTVAVTLPPAEKR